MVNGYIALHRQLWGHWLWKDKPFSKGQAWIDMLMLANHQAVKTPYKKTITTIERGELIRSERQLAERWGWSKSKVHDFLKVLVSDSMILIKSDQKANRISVLNYSEYQTNPTNKKPIKNQLKTSRKPVKNLNNNVNKGNNVNNVNNKEKAKLIIQTLNEKTNRNFSDTSFIENRLKAGKQEEDFITIIENQIKDPYFIENPKYLNPETLFRKKNWDKYLNNIPTSKNFSSITNQNIQSFQNWEPPQ